MKTKRYVVLAHEGSYLAGVRGWCEDAQAPTPLWTRDAHEALRWRTRTLAEAFVWNALAREDRSGVEVVALWFPSDVKGVDA